MGNCSMSCVCCGNDEGGQQSQITGKEPISEFKNELDSPIKESQILYNAKRSSIQHSRTNSKMISPKEITHDSQVNNGPTNQNY